MKPVSGVAEPVYDEYQWSSCSTYRPLFYYQQQSEIEAPVPGQGSFLERCSSQWWLREAPEQQIKDYFLLRDGRGRASWVYRDFDGRWFKQGEYW